jgi:hypothetical protein
MNAQHHPWEMVALVSASGPGTQGILQRSVEMFYQAIGLGVVCCGWRIGDVEQFAVGCPSAHNADLN